MFERSEQSARGASTSSQFQNRAERQNKNATNSRTEGAARTAVVDTRIETRPNFDERESIPEFICQFDALVHLQVTNSFSDDNRAHVSSTLRAPATKAICKSSSSTHKYTDRYQVNHVFSLQKRSCVTRLDAFF
jgi:hypothetical protein